MAVDTTLLELALELLESYDPTLDTSEGSSIRTKFLDPFLERVGGSPLDGDLETFLAERVSTELDADVSPLSGMRDLVIRACTVILEPFRREVSAIKLVQSLQNYELMTKSELNALLANYFTEIQDGEKSRGTARIYFPTARSVVVTPLHQFSTGGGLNFFPTTAQSLNSVQMSFNQEGSLYYMDVLLEAESPGTEYNIEPGELSSVVGISGVSRVTNLANFEDGLAEETKAEAVARTQNGITVRNLLTARGVNFVIPENFPARSVIQVIGKGDDEMQRDVISGPVAISDIPGGLTGVDSPDIGSGQTIHIGGYTDIYVYQEVPDVDDIDIEDLTDKGFRVYAGTHGFTAAGPSTNTFQDLHGFFTLRGVTAGDLLLLDDQAITITVVSSTTLTLGTAIDGGQFERTYEIVRKVSGQVTVPLYDLVAEDADGTAVVDEDDDPICPVPGSTAKAALSLSSVNVKKKDVPWSSIARQNIRLPLLRVTAVEQLDPITLEGSGTFIPMRDFFLSKVLSDFSGGSPSTKATGTIRTYFRDAVSAWVTRTDTRFSFETLEFQPITETQGSNFTSTSSGTNGGSTITLTNNNFTSGGLGLVAAGYRIEILSGAAAGTYTVIGGAFSSPNTVLTIRETLPGTFSGVDWILHVGVNPAVIELDTALNLYYFDVDVQALVNGAAGNLTQDTNFDSVTDLISEGWSLKTTKSVLSFSTKELPYLQMSEWVNDTTYIGDTLDAPAFRVSYEYAGDLVDIQTYAADSDNRVVAEDTLIRHFLPAYVRFTAVVAGDAAAAKTQMVEYINELSPTEDLEVSDLVANVYEVGVTKVTMPLYLVYMGMNVDRSWTGLISQDTLGSARTQHFIADEASIQVTVSS